MGSNKTKDAMESKKIEEWLEQSLVPVDPNPTFVRRLRGRMINYHGGAVPSGWMLVVMGGVIIALIAATLGLALRMILAVFSLLGLFERQQRIRRKADAAA